MRRRDEPALPFGAGIHSPGRARFSLPGEVVASPLLSLEEKREVLLGWLEDEKALLVAEAEGMHGERPSQIDPVSRALRQLEE